ncbi:hypothetical protein GOODEAATRI_033634 [Goodea atripinnis]|uniref:Uncharacterized protein n=1 Tax=Goodea atripinnis TaxID=208336 RepID=A0ABV0PJE1_9TELE
MWTGCQSITGQHRDTQDKQPNTLITPKGNIERPINLTVMFLGCGRMLKYPEKTHACTGRKCKLHAETVLPTAPPCSPWMYVLIIILSRKITFSKLDKKTRLEIYHDTCQTKKWKS